MPEEKKQESQEAQPSIKGEERILLEWKSIERPFKERGRDFYSTVLVLAVLIGIILFFIEGLMPVLLVASVVFVVFVMSKAQPRVVEHKITTRGIETERNKFWWSELIVFWFEEKWGYDLVHVLTARNWPRQILLVLPESGEIEKEKVKEVLGNYLPLEKPQDSWLDKAVNWLGDKVPLDG